MRGLLQVVEPNRALTSIVGPGEIFGLSDAVFEPPTMFYYRALLDCWIGRINRDDFCRIVFGVSPEKAEVLLDFVFKRWWGGAVLRSFGQTGLSVEHRLSRALRELGAKIGVRDSRGTIVDAAITHQTLADLICASRPKTTEAIGKLICSGRIIRDHQRMILADACAVPAPQAKPRRRASNRG